MNPYYLDRHYGPSYLLSSEMRERLSMETVARGEGPGSFQRPALADLVRDAHEPAEPQPDDPLD